MAMVIMLTLHRLIFSTNHLSELIVREIFPINIRSWI